MTRLKAYCATHPLISRGPWERRRVGGATAIIASHLRLRAAPLTFTSHRLTYEPLAAAAAAAAAADAADAAAVLSLPGLTLPRITVPAPGATLISPSPPQPQPQPFHFTCPLMIHSSRRFGKFIGK
jgi:hypothetical protein